MDITIRDADFSALLASFGADKRMRVVALKEALTEFAAADDKQAVVIELRAKYGHLIPALSMKTLYRRLQVFRKQGMQSLLPASARRKLEDDGTEHPPEFVRFWTALCGQNQRRTAPAWRSLIDDHLRAGHVIPGYKTDWRGIWAQERPGWAVPESCPYTRGGCLPRGFSQRTLDRLAVRHYQRSAARQGTAAARNFLPTIPTTRVGLPFARVFVIDDVEHDVITTFLGNMDPQGVVELGALELLTGDYCAWGAKPIRERVDGTREKLREDFNRYLVAYICCVLGFSQDGAMICGEHGTAKLPKSLLETLTRIGGGLVQFGAGGILNQPIAKGLYLGLRRGNFRFKAALESHHNLKKNELAGLPGQKGADPEHAPEDLESKKQHHRALMKACVALADTRPDIINQVASPFPPYFRYMDAVTLLYDRIANRPEHNLEGWEECGFLRSEWRIPGDPTWKPESLLAEQGTEDALAIRGIIERNPAQCWRVRRMSPREAFNHCTNVYRDRLVRFADYAVPEILGPELADRVDVATNGTLIVPNRYLPNRSTQVAAIVRHPDGTVETLRRGDSVNVWVSPFDGRNAYVSTADFAFLGVAPVMVPGTKVDEHAWHRNVAILNAMEKTELKRLAPIAEQRMREHQERAETNLAVLGQRIPKDLITAAADRASASSDADDAILEMYGQHN